MDDMQIILIPGLMNDGWVWRHQIGPLSRIAPVTIARNDGCTTLGAMAERILDQTSGPLTLIGHSMGGRIALEAYARDPDRVARLVILDSGVAGAAPAEAEGRLKLVEIAERQGMTAVAATWLPPMLATRNQSHQGLVSGITHMLERCTVTSFAGQQQALIQRPDRTALLPSITCPFLAVSGSEDSWSPPADHIAMARSVANGTCEIIHGVGHMVPVEAPTALAGLLQAFVEG